MRPPLRGDSAGGEGGLTRGTNEESDAEPGPPWPPEDPRAANEYVLDHIFSFGFKNSNALDGIQDQPKWTRGILWRRARSALE